MQAALQAAGHDGARQGEGLFIKPTTQNEIDFYQWIVHQPTVLSSFVPLFMGTLCEQAPASNGAKVEENLKPLIVLEDLCEGFTEPSIMDVKLGSILWDASALPKKRERLMNVSRTTTSGSLGFRIAGLTVINAEGQRVSYDKQFGREATSSNIDEYLLHFWPKLHANDYLYSALLSTITQLEQLRSALDEEPLDLHSASILIIYEGNAEAMKRKAEIASTTQHESENESDDSEENKNKLVDVRLIDFAHSTRAQKTNDDVLKGIDELIKAFKRLLNSS